MLSLSELLDKKQEYFESKGKIYKKGFSFVFFSCPITRSS